jgi:Transglutaminase-like superfamily/Domain of Unknown Function with PDB structure (DUF3857)
MLMRLVLALVLGLPCLGVLAQASLADLDGLRDQFPNQKAIYLYKKRQIRLQLVNGRVSATTQNESSVLHLRPYSDLHSNASVVFSRFNPLARLTAYTLKPKPAGGHDTLRVKKVITKNLVNQEVFYDDYLEKSFIYPVVEVGSQTVLAYDEVLTEPRFLGLFYFGADLPVLESVFEVVADTAIHLAFGKFHLGTLGLQLEATEQQAGGQNHYRWVARQVSPHANEPQSPALAHRAAHLIPYITRVSDPRADQPGLPNVAALHRWYAGLLPRPQPAASPTPLQLLADSLGATAKNDREKAEKIYKWVQSHIQYIAFEDGYGGLVPRAPDTTFYRRYGDCKDMSVLLVALLRRSGLEAYPAWVGTRKLPYRYAEVPTPIADNHMVASLKLGRETLFLDATDPRLPLGLPSVMIQGKEALISLDGSRYEIKPVPVVEATTNQLSDSSVWELQGDTSYVRTYLRLGGHAVSEWPSLAPGQDSVQLLWQLFGRRDLVGKVRALGPKNEIFEINSVLIHHSKLIGEELFINLHLNRRHDHYTFESRRQFDAVFPYSFMDNSTTVFKIPKGWEVQSVPANTEVVGEPFGFSIQYEVAPGQITMRKRFYLNSLRLAKEQHKLWNDMIETLSRSYRQSVLLKRIYPKIKH